MSFVDRMSYFISQYLGYGIDCRDYWLEETRTRYTQYILNALDTEPWILLEPTSPKVGDELVVSAFNIPSIWNGMIYLQVGQEWHDSFVGIRFALPAGNSLNNSINYILSQNEAGENIILYAQDDNNTLNMWSNMTTTVLEN